MMAVGRTEGLRVFALAAFALTACAEGATPNDAGRRSRVDATLSATDADAGDSPDVDGMTPSEDAGLDTDGGNLSDSGLLRDAGLLADGGLAGDGGPGTDGGDRWDAGWDRDGSVSDASSMSFDSATLDAGLLDAGLFDGARVDGGSDDASLGADSGVSDSGVSDSGVSDSGVPDSGVPDSGVPDSGVPDSGVPDSGVPDSGVPDSGVPDSGVPDSGVPDSGLPDSGMDAGPPECPVVVADSNCDPSLRPIVFVHGIYGSGDNMSNVAQLFGSNGYCQDRFVAIDYNSLNLFVDTTTRINAAVDTIRSRTGFSQVDIIGHAEGTDRVIAYLQSTTNRAKVARYVHISGSGTVPGSVATLSLSSQLDSSSGPVHAAGGNNVRRVTLTTEDHFGLAASTSSFVEIWRFLEGSEPTYTEIQCGEAMITLEGVAESFADNVPLAGGRLEVYELGSAPRDRGAPVLVVIADQNGGASPFQLRRNVAYEFRGFRADGSLVGHMYFAPFKRSNRLLRLLVPSDNLVIALFSTANIVRGPNHSAVVARSAAGAFRRDRGDSLRVNGSEVLTTQNAGDSSNPLVALFMYDGNRNQRTDLGVLFSAPFLSGSDVYIPAATPAWTEYVWNGRTFRIPNWPSDQGLVSIMFP